MAVTILESSIPVSIKVELKIVSEDILFKSGARGTIIAKKTVTCRYHG